MLITLKIIEIFQSSWAYVKTDILMKIEENLGFL